jgi:hypothetical protein
MCNTSSVALRTLRILTRCVALGVISLPALQHGDRERHPVRLSPEPPPRARGIRLRLAGVLDRGVGRGGAMRYYKPGFMRDRGFHHGQDRGRRHDPGEHGGHGVHGGVHGSDGQVPLPTRERRTPTLPRWEVPCRPSYEIYEEIEREIAQQWPEGSYRQVEGAYHEIYLEKPGVVVDTVERVASK